MMLFRLSSTLSHSGKAIERSIRLWLMDRAPAPACYADHYFEPPYKPCEDPLTTYRSPIRDLNSGDFRSIASYNTNPVNGFNHM